MPLPSCRISPARSMSLCEMASASAGSSRSVGTSDFAIRILVGVLLLVGALDARLVAEPLDRFAAQDVGLHDLLEIALLHAAVPHVFRVDHDHRPVAALREAAGLVDADLLLAAGLDDLAAQVLHEPLDVAVLGAVVAGGAHEHVAVVLAHQALAPAASFAARRSLRNLSTSSRIAVTISFSGTFRTTSPPLKMSPIPRPPATPMSAARASPGPLTSQPITAMWISSLRPRNSSSTSLASFTRSTSARPHDGHDTNVSPPLRSPSDFRISMPTRTSSVGSAESETRIVSPMPSLSSAPSPTADLMVPTPGVPASVTPRCSG